MINRGVNESFTEAARGSLRVLKNKKGERQGGKGCGVM